MLSLFKEGDTPLFIANGDEVRVRDIEARVTREGVEYSVIPTQGEPETFWAKAHQLSKR